ncbi:MAG: DUF1566 domain-containing protein [Deltaproteobacteria bacterium]|nr:DUF1566 domain-containing protein [Deltaproteobacteria bacterium]
MRVPVRNLALAALAVVALSASAARAATPAQKCQAGKNKAAGKYAACRHGAEAKLATTGDGAAYATAIGKCTTKYGAAWQKLEANAGGACPSNGDETAIGTVVDGCTTNIATAVGGGVLTDCPADLAACLAAPQGQRLKTEQYACYDAGGVVIPCAGTGQDGELQKGLARSYTDNGDGTITDDRTGLMWEKLSDDGSLHDKDNYYTWTNAFAVKIAGLNAGGGFAGHTDWRLPNVNELQSLVSYGAVNPSVSAAFNTACAPACTVTTCSCTQSNFYWSATTYQDSPSLAWLVFFFDGDVYADGKPDNYYVRGVRGGS